MNPIIETSKYKTGQTISMACSKCKSMKHGRTVKKSLRRTIVKNLGTESAIRKTDFLTLISNILSEHLLEFQKNVDTFIT